MKSKVYIVYVKNHYPMNATCDMSLSSGHESHLAPVIRMSVTGVFTPPVPHLVSCWSIWIGTVRWLCSSPCFGLSLWSIFRKKNINTFRCIENILLYIFDTNTNNFTDTFIAQLNLNVLGIYMNWCLPLVLFIFISNIEGEKFSFLCFWLPECWFINR